ncbi:hypothetical protein ABGB16_01640 [Micromonospora sp. B11E3]|uniref:hypothetical protein n=1 Tax=Micromonospora sp. B11E3 TaxID=3153562 RepID=UPI00325C40F1
MVNPPRPHQPIRPLWLCRTCAAPWPCATARLALLREYADDRVALLVYLGGQLHDAADELYRLNPHDGPEPRQLFDRFLGWALIRLARDGPRVDRFVVSARAAPSGTGSSGSPRSETGPAESR